LILAVPVTIISKAAIGEAPFKHVPVLAQGTSGPEIAAGVIGCLGGLINGLLDASASKESSKGSKRSPDGFFELVSVLCSQLVWQLSAKARGQEAEDNPENPVKASEGWLSFYEAISWMVDVFSILIAPLSKKTGRRIKRTSKWGPCAGTVAGAGHLGLMIWKSDETKEGAGYAVAAALTTAPEILSFLSLVPKNPWAIGILAGSDAVAAGISIGVPLYDVLS
jgi:hypothetical protein